MGVKGGEDRRGEGEKRGGGRKNKGVRRRAIEMIMRGLLGISVYVRIKNLRKMEWGNAFK